MNYRDLQNISNLSQQILVEGANEEHNVLNRWPYTSPYLQEDYNQEDYKPWDFGPKQNAQAKHAELAQRKAAGGSAPGTATRANKIASVGREMRTTLDKDSAMTMTTPSKQGLQPSTQRHTAAALRGAGGGMTARTKFDVKPLKSSGSIKGGGSSAQDVTDDPNSKPISARTRDYKVGGSQGYGISGIKLADSYDLYDIILSHLLDEGYADTQEQAEVIMTNMSEEWRESIMIDEGYKSFPHDKVEAKAKRLEMDSRKNEPLTGKSDSEVNSILARKKKSGERATSLRLASRTAHSYLPQKKAERNKTQKEQVDLYDIILSHLLDEGYAETQEQAEVIMVNMSEDWRESICEGYKKLPVGKMLKQAARHSNPEQVTKMGKVADDHNPANAERKERDNRRIGGRKRDAGRPRSNELQDNW